MITKNSINRSTMILTIAGVFAATAARSTDVQKQARQLLTAEAVQAPNHLGGSSESVQLQAAHILKADAIPPSHSRSLRHEVAWTRSFSVHQEDGARRLLRAVSGE